jgi:hypothetical protein
MQSIMWDSLETNSFTHQTAAVALRWRVPLAVQPVTTNSAFLDNWFNTNLDEHWIVQRSYSRAGTMDRHHACQLDRLTCQWMGCATAS